ncbi:hypothetical protein LguiA_030928 [Lonicera macranthoides]
MDLLFLSLETPNCDYMASRGNFFSGSQEFEAGGAQFPRSLRNVHETFTLLGLESSSLPWFVRYKVDVGIAEAIGYLHNGTERCVVHRDIKPSNILLSSKRTPKMRNCLFS